MTRHTTVASMLLAVVLPAAWAQDEAAKLETNIEKASYLIGRNIGETIKGDDLGLNVDLLVKGLRESLEGKESIITDEEAEKIMMAFQQDMETKMAAKAEEATQKNQAEGAKFLEENKQREEVKVTESGLQYEVLEAGSGPKPAATDTVSVHYHGTLLDGTVFDSSVERNVPAEFPVDGVIAGWTEALQLMPTGSKWKLYIPSELAYGERGAGRDIGPHATLVFEVELLSIEGKE